MELLSKQAEAEAQKGNWSGLIRIVDMLNKMDGTYETKKREAELEKAAKEEERKKAAEEEERKKAAEQNPKHMSIAKILDELQERGCRPKVHP